MPVPDMADSIWTGIEAQLDVVPEPAKPSRSPKLKGKGWYVAAVPFAAIVVMWWHYSSKHESQTGSPAKTPPTEIMAPAADSLKIVDSSKQINVPFKAVKKQKDFVVPKDSLQNDKRPDTLAAPVLPPKLELQAPQNIAPFIPAIDSGHAAPKLRKPKGVKGITNDDYRISTGKDTANGLQ
jgi:hypothetical protein